MGIIKSSKVLVVILTIAALSLTVTTLAVLNVGQNVSSSGTIRTSPDIGIFADQQCTANMTSINWGSIGPGETAAQIVYIKNTGTTALSLCPLDSSSWNPSNAGNYLSLSWNQTGTQLLAGQSVAAMITLTVSSNITGITSFSNTISIWGSC